MANTDNATPEIMYFTLICVVICVISDILCYRGLIQNSQLYETKIRNEQLEYERSTQYRYYEKINELASARDNEVPPRFQQRSYNGDEPLHFSRYSRKGKGNA